MRLPKSALLAALFLATIRAAGAADPPTGNFDIVVIAGQSNAVGKGYGSYVDPEQNPETDGRIWQFGRFGADDGKIVPAVDPLQNWFIDPETDVRAGFGLPFARRYVHAALRDGRSVLLIPAAKDATSILQWTGTPAHPLKDQGDYTDMRDRIRAVIAAYPGSRIVAFHWQQGEADIEAAANKANVDHKDMPNAWTYHLHLIDLIADLRSDFPDQGEFPFLIGEPSRLNVTQAIYNPVRPYFVAAMKAVATHSRCAAFVPSNGLQTNGQALGDADYMHFSAEGQARLGARRLAVLAVTVPHCLPATDFKPR